MSICRKHPSEPSVGVCAPCLRDRLLTLQSCVSPRPCPPSTSIHTQQPDHSLRPLFNGARLPPPPTQGKRSGFSVLSTLLGTSGGGPSPSGEHCSHRTHDRPYLTTPQRLANQPPEVPPSFSSWLAALFAVRCKRNRRRGRSDLLSDALGPTSDCLSETPSGMKDKVEPPPEPLQQQTSRFQKFRGMSPASEQEEELQKHEEREENRAAGSSPSGSGSSCSSSSNLPGLPCPTTARNMCRQNPTAVKTGLAMCFSPLVGAQLHHRRRRRLVVAADNRGGCSGELLKPEVRLRRHGQHQYHNHRLRHCGGGGGGVKLCPNRSRKLVDLGRFR